MDLRERSLRMRARERKMLRDFQRKTARIEKPRIRWRWR